MINELVVIAGGKGTRMAEFFPGVPKLMLPLKNGQTVLSNLVSEISPSRLFLALGNDYELITLPKELASVELRSSVETKPLGTFGALKKLVKENYQELPNVFPVMLGDLLCAEFDLYQRRDLQLALNAGENCFFFAKNNHPYDSDRVILQNDYEIRELITKNSETTQFCNRTLSGLYVFLKQDIASMPLDVGDITHDFMPWLLERGQVRCRQLTGILRDIGTPNRYIDIVESGRYLLKRKYLFVDLDGTLIADRGSSKEAKFKPIQLKLPCVDMIKKAQEMGHKIIIVTNQGDIAKGFKTDEDFRLSMSRLEEELWACGVWIDDYFYCPHHPEKGFPGEVPELKVPCACRKPKIGMFLEAKEKWNCEATRSAMIGDSTADQLFAEELNIKFFDVNELKSNPNMMTEFDKWIAE